MRYGLLALSIAMLTSGGVAAQSALSISDSIAVTIPDRVNSVERSAAYGPLPYSAARARIARLAAR